MRRSVQSTKDFIVDEGQRVNGTLVAFENKFEKLVDSVRLRCEADLARLTESFQTHIGALQKRADTLEDMLEEEKRERVRQTKQTHQQILDRLALLEAGQAELGRKLGADVTALRQDLRQNEFVLTERIAAERRQRLEQQKAARDDLVRELEFQRKHVEDLSAKLHIEFNHVTTNIQKEVQHRLKEQDDVLDNLSRVVVTLQKTLDVLGSN